MKKNSKIFLIVLLIFLSQSCKISDHYFVDEKIFNYGNIIDRYILVNELYSLSDTSAVFKISLPDNYINLVEQTNAGYDYGDIIYYVYANSSNIYISNYNVCVNEKKIRLQDNANVENRFIDPIFYIKSNTMAPTMIFEGVDTNGLYWKDIRYEWICYGYVDVLKEDKALFDSILNSVKRIK